MRPSQGEAVARKMCDIIGGGHSTVEARALLSVLGDVLVRIACEHLEEPLPDELDRAALVACCDKLIEAGEVPVAPGIITLEAHIRNSPTNLPPITPGEAPKQ
jgi:hypothetical protein